MQTILIVGHYRKSIAEYLLEHGYEYVVLADIRKVTNPEKRLKRRVVCDFSSHLTIDRALEELQKRHTIDGLLVTYENYVLPAAYLADKLGVPGMSIEAARACTDKQIMRELFAKSPEKISPDFAEIHSEEELIAFAKAHSYPLILKPANLAKSLLVTKNHDESELRANYHKMLDAIQGTYAKYAPTRQPKILVEEFMEGPIHSVDAYVDIDGTPHVLEQVVDYQTGYDIGYDDNFHYSRILPSKLAAEEIEAIRHTAALGCKALGMTSSPAHIEIIRTKDGPRIVEIGARNGGYRERMHWLANGIDITANALALSLGKPLQIEATKPAESVAVLELFPKTAGVFVGLHEQEQVEKLSSLFYLAVKPQPGAHIGKSSDGHKMAAIIILHNADKKQFEQDLAFVDQHVYVEVTGG